MSLLFEEKIATNRPAFVAKVRQIAAALQINPNWLMAVMYKETGGTFSPSISNKSCLARKGDPNKCAAGLIQFMPTTAQGMGTSIAQLRAMSAVQQLDVVYAFYKRYAGRIKSYEELYLVTFYPIALGKGENFKFGTEISEARAKQIVAENPIDYNKDGYITLSDFRRYVYNGLDPTQVNATPKENTDTADNGLSIAIGLLALLAIYNAYFNPNENTHLSGALR
jgi:hypothetical protein